MLPRPPDPRDLFDFSGARELIDAAYELANEALDRAAVPPATAEQRRRFRRRRRRASVGSPASSARATPSTSGLDGTALKRAALSASSWVACFGEVEHAAGHDAEEERPRRPRS